MLRVKTMVWGVWMIIAGTAEASPPEWQLRAAAGRLQASVGRLEDIVLQASGGGGGATRSCQSYRNPANCRQAGCEWDDGICFASERPRFAAAVADGETDDVLERDALAGPFIRANVTPPINQAAVLGFQAADAAAAGDWWLADVLRGQACQALSRGIHAAEGAKGLADLVQVGVITSWFLSGEISVYWQSRNDFGC